MYEFIDDIFVILFFDFACHIFFISWKLIHILLQINTGFKKKPQYSPLAMARQ
jgi:hypothetical protein